MSASGSPRSKTRSAAFPGTTEPVSSCRPKNAAASLEAARLLGLLQVEARDDRFRDVLDALAAAARSFLGGDRGREMAGQGEPLLLRLGGDGEERIARQAIVHLDEVDVQPALEHRDCLATILRARDGDAVRKTRLGTVEQGAGLDDGGTDAHAFRDLAPPPVELPDVASHVAHARDA